MTRIELDEHGILVRSTPAVEQPVFQTTDRVYADGDWVTFDGAYDWSNTGVTWLHADGSTTTRDLFPARRVVGAANYGRLGVRIWTLSSWNVDPATHTTPPGRFLSVIDASSGELLADVPYEGGQFYGGNLAIAEEDADTAAFLSFLPPVVGPHPGQWRLERFRISDAAAAGWRGAVIQSLPMPDGGDGGYPVVRYLGGRYALVWSTFFDEADLCP